MHLFKQLKKEKLNKENQKAETEKILQKMKAYKEDWLSSFESSKGFNFSHPFDLEKYEVPESDKFFYVRDYLNQEQCRKLDFIIRNQSADRWIRLHHANRELQKWGGDVTPEGLNNIEPIPD